MHLEDSQVNVVLDFSLAVLQGHCLISFTSSTGLRVDIGQVWSCSLNRIYDLNLVMTFICCFGGQIMKLPILMSANINRGHDYNPP